LYSPSEAFLQQPVSGFRAETVYTPGESWQARRFPWKFDGLPTMSEGMVLVKHLRGIPWPEEDPAPLLIELRFRIWKLGTPTFAEVRVDPDTWDAHIDVRDLDEYTASEPKTLKRLLDVARAHTNKPGPKEGSTFYQDADDFLMRCFQEINDILERDGEVRGAKGKVASALGISDKTLTNRLRMQDVRDREVPSDWAAFVSYALKVTNKEKRRA
jgi:hypothetical protein